MGIVQHHVAPLTTILVDFLPFSYRHYQLGEAYLTLNENSVIMLELSNKGPHLLAGGWSLLNGSIRSNWNINDYEFLVEKALGSPAFFTVDVTIDDKNSSQHILEVSVSIIYDLHTQKNSYKSYIQLH